MIPKTLLQISIDPYPDEWKEYWEINKGDWQIKWFNDKDCINYLIENPDPEFPNIVDVFKSFSGAHKTDLFRYYYLYKNGGVFMDSDFFLVNGLIDLEERIKDYSCFYTVGDLELNKKWNEEVFNKVLKKPTTFNGCIGTEANHKIIYEALKHAYNTDPKELEWYHYFIVELYDIIEGYGSMGDIKIFNESHDFEDYVKVMNDGDVLGCHFFMKKKLDRNILEAYRK